MSYFDKETIKTLMELSYIDLSEEEQEALLEDLKKIIHYVEQLQELDTHMVPPCYQVLGNTGNVMRSDEVGPTLPRNEFLANARSHRGGMVSVPPVIKQS